MPITVDYTKDNADGAYSATFFLNSENPISSPASGMVQIFIGKDDPASGEKTVNMWVSASRSTEARVDVQGHTMAFGGLQSGSQDEVSIAVP
jgi:hypothetical protein